MADEVDVFQDNVNFRTSAKISIGPTSQYNIDYIIRHFDKIIEIEAKDNPAQARSAPFKAVMEEMQLFVRTVSNFRMDTVNPMYNDRFYGYQYLSNPVSKVTFTDNNTGGNLMPGGPSHYYKQGVTYSMKELMNDRVVKYAFNQYFDKNNTNSFFIYNRGGKDWHKMFFIVPDPIGSNHDADPTTKDWFNMARKLWGIFETCHNGLAVIDKEIVVIHDTFYDFETNAPLKIASGTPHNRGSLEWYFGVFGSFGEVEILNNVNVLKKIISNFNRSYDNYINYRDNYGLEDFPDAVEARRLLNNTLGSVNRRINEDGYISYIEIIDNLYKSLKGSFGDLSRVYQTEGNMIINMLDTSEIAEKVEFKESDLEKAVKTLDAIKMKESELIKYIDFILDPKKEDDKVPFADASYLLPTFNIFNSNPRPSTDLIKIINDYVTISKRIQSIPDNAIKKLLMYPRIKMEMNDEGKKIYTVEYLDPTERGKQLELIENEKSSFIVRQAATYGKRDSKITDVDSTEYPAYIDLPLNPTKINQFSIANQKYYISVPKSSPPGFEWPAEDKGVKMVGINTKYSQLAHGYHNYPYIYGGATPKYNKFTEEYNKLIDESKKVIDNVEIKMKYVNEKMEESDRLFFDNDKVFDMNVLRQRNEYLLNMKNFLDISRFKTLVKDADLDAVAKAVFSYKRKLMKNLDSFYVSQEVGKLIKGKELAAMLVPTSIQSLYDFVGKIIQDISNSQGKSGTYSTFGNHDLALRESPIMGKLMDLFEQTKNTLEASNILIISLTNDTTVDTAIPSILELEKEVNNVYEKLSSLNNELQRLKANTHIILGDVAGIKSDMGKMIKRNIALIDTFATKITEYINNYTVKSQIYRQIFNDTIVTRRRQKVIMKTYEIHEKNFRSIEPMFDIQQDILKTSGNKMRIVRTNDNDPFGIPPNEQKDLEEHIKKEKDQMKLNLKICKHNVENIPKYFREKRNDVRLANMYFIVDTAVTDLIDSYALLFNLHFDNFFPVILTTTQRYHDNFAWWLNNTITALITRKVNDVNYLKPELSGNIFETAKATHAACRKILEAFESNINFTAKVSVLNPRLIEQLSLDYYLKAMASLMRKVGVMYFTGQAGFRENANDNYDDNKPLDRMGNNYLDLFNDPYIDESTKITFLKQLYLLAEKMIRDGMTYQLIGRDKIDVKNVRGYANRYHKTIAGATHKLHDQTPPDDYPEKKDIDNRMGALKKTITDNTHPKLGDTLDKNKSEGKNNVIYFLKTFDSYSSVNEGDPANDHLSVTNTFSGNEHQKKVWIGQKHDGGKENLSDFFHAKEENMIKIIEYLKDCNLKMLPSNTYADLFANNANPNSFVTIYNTILLPKLIKLISSKIQLFYNKLTNYYTTLMSVCLVNDTLSDKYEQIKLRISEYSKFSYDINLFDVVVNYTTQVTDDEKNSLESARKKAFDRPDTSGGGLKSQELAKKTIENEFGNVPFDTIIDLFNDGGKYGIADGTARSGTQLDEDLTTINTGLLSVNVIDAFDKADGAGELSKWFISPSNTNNVTSAAANIPVNTRNNYIHCAVLGENEFFHKGHFFVNYANHYSKLPNYIDELVTEVESKASECLNFLSVINEYISLDPAHNLVAINRINVRYFFNYQNYGIIVHNNAGSNWVPNAVNEFIPPMFFFNDLSPRNHVETDQYYKNIVSRSFAGAFITPSGRSIFDSNLACLDTKGADINNGDENAVIGFSMIGDELYEDIKTLFKPGNGGNLAAKITLVGANSINTLSFSDANRLELKFDVTPVAGDGQFNGKGADLTIRPNTQALMKKIHVIEINHADATNITGDEIKEIKKILNSIIFVKKHQRTMVEIMKTIKNTSPDEDATNILLLEKMHVRNEQKSLLKKTVNFIRGFIDALIVQKNELITPLVNLHNSKILEYCDRIPKEIDRLMVNDGEFNLKMGFAFGFCFKYANAAFTLMAHVAYILTHQYKLQALMKPFYDYSNNNVTRTDVLEKITGLGKLLNTDKLIGGGGGLMKAVLDDYDIAKNELGKRKNTLTDTLKNINFNTEDPDDPTKTLTHTKITNDTGEKFYIHNLDNKLTDDLYHFLVVNKDGKYANLEKIRKTDQLIGSMNFLLEEFDIEDIFRRLDIDLDNFYAQIANVNNFTSFTYKKNGGDNVCPMIKIPLGQTIKTHMEKLIKDALNINGDPKLSVIITKINNFGHGTGPHINKKEAQDHINQFHNFINDYEQKTWTDAVYKYDTGKFDTIGTLYQAIYNDATASAIPIDDGKGQELNATIRSLVNVTFTTNLKKTDSRCSISYSHNDIFNTIMNHSNGAPPLTTYPLTAKNCVRLIKGLLNGGPLHFTDTGGKLIGSINLGGNNFPSTEVTDIYIGWLISYIAMFCYLVAIEHMVYVIDLFYKKLVDTDFLNDPDMYKGIKCMFMSGFQQLINKKFGKIFGVTDAQKDNFGKKPYCFEYNPTMLSFNNNQDFTRKELNNYSNGVGGVPGNENPGATDCYYVMTGPKDTNFMKSLINELKLIDEYDSFNFVNKLKEEFAHADNLANVEYRVSKELNDNIYSISRNVDKYNGAINLAGEVIFNDSFKKIGFVDPKEIASEAQSCMSHYNSITRQVQRQITNMMTTATEYEIRNSQIINYSDFSNTLGKRIGATDDDLDNMLVYKYFSFGLSNFYLDVINAILECLEKPYDSMHQIEKYIYTYHYVTLFRCKKLFEWMNVYKLKKQDEEIEQIKARTFTGEKFLMKKIIVKDLTGTVRDVFDEFNMIRPLLDEYQSTVMNKVSLHLRINDYIPSAPIADENLFIPEHKTYWPTIPEYITYKKYRVFDESEDDENKLQIRKNNIFPSDIAVKLGSKINPYDVASYSESKKLLKKKYPLVFDSIKKHGGINFERVYTMEKFPDPSVMSSYMSLAPNISKGKGTLLITYGYSGVGKTVTLFGRSGMNGLLQSTLNNFEDKKIFFRTFEIYGLGVPYDYYWNPKNGTDNKAFPNIYNVLIHHRLTVSGPNVTVDPEPAVLHNRFDIFSYIMSLDDPADGKPFAMGRHNIEIYNDVVRDSVFNGLLDDKDKEIARWNTNPYVSIDKSHYQDFDKIVTAVENVRKSKSLASRLLNHNIPTIKKTVNNPDSSRSIMVYDFQIEIKEGTGVNERIIYVPFIIYDMPGREDIYRSYVTTTNEIEPGDNSVRTFSNFSSGIDRMKPNLVDNFFPKPIKSSLIMNPLVIPSFIPYSVMIGPTGIITKLSEMLNPLIMQNLVQEILNFPIRTYVPENAFSLVNKKGVLDVTKFDKIRNGGEKTIENLYKDSSEIKTLSQLFEFRYTKIYDTYHTVNPKFHEDTKLLSGSEFTSFFGKFVNAGTLPDGSIYGKSMADIKPLISIVDVFFEGFMSVKTTSLEDVMTRYMAYPFIVLIAVLIKNAMFDVLVQLIHDISASLGSKWDISIIYLFFEAYFINENINGVLKFLMDRIPGSSSKLVATANKSMSDEINSSADHNASTKVLISFNRGLGTTKSGYKFKTDSPDTFCTLEEEYVKGIELDRVLSAKVQEFLNKYSVKKVGNLYKYYTVGGAESKFIVDVHFMATLVRNKGIYDSSKIFRSGKLSCTDMEPHVPYSNVSPTDVWNAYRNTFIGYDEAKKSSLLGQINKLRPPGEAFMALMSKPNSIKVNVNYLDNQPVGDADKTKNYDLAKLPPLDNTKVTNVIKPETGEYDTFKNNPLVEDYLAPYSKKIDFYYVLFLVTNNQKSSKSEEQIKLIENSMPFITALMGSGKKKKVTCAQ